MAKKQEKEVEKWVTINGARVPIFKDGSIGGPKALRDKVKATQDKKTSAKNYENKSFNGMVLDMKKDGLSIADSGNMGRGGLKDGETLSVYDKNTKQYHKAIYHKDKSGKSSIDIQKKETKKEKSTKSPTLKLTAFKPGDTIEIEQFSSITGKSKGYKSFTLGSDNRWSAKDGESFDNNEHELSKHSRSSKSGIQGNIKKSDDTKENQIARNKKEADERNGKTKVDKEQATKAITELQMYGKKKNGFPYSKKDAEEAVKSMTPAQIKKLADKRDERRAYQQKLTDSSDMSLKKQYKTASFEEKKEIQAEMHSRGYFYRDGKWIDRFKARNRQWGKGDDWD